MPPEAEPRQQDRRRADRDPTEAAGASPLGPAEEAAPILRLDDHPGDRPRRRGLPGTLAEAFGRDGIEAGPVCQGRPSGQPSPEVPGQLPTAWVSTGRVLRQGLQADRLQFGRNFGAEVAQRRWGGVQGVVDQHAEGTRERHPAAKHLVEDHAEAVLVAGRLDLVAPAGRLLGGEIGRSSQDRAGPSQLRSAGAQVGEAEVGQVGTVLGVQEHVRGLHVAVDDALLVGVVQGVGQVAGDPGRAWGSSGPSSIASARLRPAMKAEAM